MKLEPVNLKKNLSECLEFRRDAHILSYGSDNSFNIEECTAWFNSLNNTSGFEHVILNEKIIGQIEFKSGIKDNKGVLTGYINLLYLLPDYRRKGYGLELQKYIFSKLIADGCVLAYLRYLPENTIAHAFYVKNGWSPLGVPNERGQLMVQRLI